MIVWIHKRGGKEYGRKMNMGIRDKRKGRNRVSDKDRK
jgi:hypothetical protein